MRDLLTQLVRVQSEMTVILGDLIYRTACAARSDVGRVHLCYYCHSISSRLDHRDAHRSCRRCLNLEHRSRRSVCFIPSLISVSADDRCTSCYVCFGDHLHRGFPVYGCRRLAIVFKCAILAAGGVAIANQLLPEELLAAIVMGR